MRKILTFSAIPALIVAIVQAGNPSGFCTDAAAVACKVLHRNNSAFMDVQNVFRPAGPMPRVRGWNDDALQSSAPLATPSIAPDARFSFAENKGQVRDQNGAPRPDVSHLFTDANGLKVHLRKTGFSYETWKLLNADEIEADRKRHDKNRPSFEKEFVRPVAPGYHVHRVDVELLDANPNPRIASHDASPDYDNYYTVIPAVHEVRRYQYVVYHDVYPNIDLKFYTNAEGKFEYDFVVRPGGDARQIRMEYRGANALQLTENGLVMNTSVGSVEEGKVNAWLESAVSKDVKHRINVRPILLENILTFSVSDYDKNQTLVIDPPVRAWGTYYGGNRDEASWAVAVASDGSVYMAGQTQSADGIATGGAHQTVLAVVDPANSFLAKFDANGVRQWGTYYGGDNNEEPYSSVAVAPDGSVYLAGSTLSYNNIATPGAHQSTHGGTYPDGSSSNTYDAFLVKFSANGVRQWGTYYGGLAEELGHSVKVGPDGSVYLAGNCSSDAIATPGAHQSTYGGGARDGFLAKFDANGVRQWATYYGGPSAESVRSMDVGPDGSVYIGGHTMSNSGIATSGAHQSTLSPRNNVFTINNDAFLAKFNANGVRQWATYYGGSDNDLLWSVAVASDGSVYMAGQTRSDSIATAGAHQQTHANLGPDNEDEDGFLVKFNANGVRQWATYYGGESWDVCYSVAVSPDGPVYIAGNTYSQNGIVTDDAHQTEYGNSQKAFLVKFDANGLRQWGTYYGGRSGTSGKSVAVSSDGSVYLAGYTTSDDAIATPGAHQETRGSTGNFSDAYLVKFSTSGSTTTRKTNLFNDNFRILTGSDKTKVEITVAAPTSGTLALMDAWGRNIWRRSVELPAGTTLVPIEAPAGVYVVSLTTASGVQARKFVNGQ